MLQVKWTTIFSLATLLHLLAAGNVQAQTLSVRVEGIRNSRGELGVAVFNDKIGYPLHLEHSYEVKWFPLQQGQTVVDAVFDSLPPGEYAVSVVHDENGGRLIERNKQGLPKEGVGFSNNQKVTSKAPPYRNAQFPLSADENKTIVIHLDYAQGSGPVEVETASSQIPDEAFTDGLKVRVQGIRPASGEVGVAVFHQKTGYPIHIEHAYDAQWITTTKGQEAFEVVFDSLPDGEYAVSVFHDEDADRILDRSVMGFPEEGVGFSNDQRVVLGAPAFQESKFSFTAAEKKSITITLDYRGGLTKPPQEPKGTPLTPLDEKTQSLSGGLEVQVDGIRGGTGELGVFVFSEEEGFPFELSHALEAQWVKAGEGQPLDVKFDALPVGTYAVAVVHDDNGDRQVERNRQSFPKEGVGFSNHQEVTLVIPRFHQCAFTLSAEEKKKIVINLDYTEKMIEYKATGGVLIEVEPGTSRKIKDL